MSIQRRPRARLDCRDAFGLEITDWLIARLRLHRGRTRRAIIRIMAGGWRRTRRAVIRILAGGRRIVTAGAGAGIVARIAPSFPHGAATGRQTEHHQQPASPDDSLLHGLAPLHWKPQLRQTSQVRQISGQVCSVKAEWIYALASRGAGPNVTSVKPLAG